MSQQPFKNKFQDYSGPTNGYILSKRNAPEYTAKFDSTIKLLLSKLEAEFPSLESSKDYSVYTGSTGVALMFFLLANKTNNVHALQWPQTLLKNNLKRLKGHRECFLNGDAGLLALGAAIFNSQKPELCQDFFKRLLSIHHQVVNKASSIPDEMLYGRAGYLYALLFVNKYVGPNTVEQDIIRKVVTSILDSGQNLARRYGSGIPLQYEWHGKNYLGGAHGVAGIMYTLLQAKDVITKDEMNILIKPTIDHLLSLQFPSGNFPSSYGNDKDRLVQWCHGAPGFVQLMSKAYQVFGDKSYLNSALKCGEIVWKQGLVWKGYSICHGVAGNGYTFLQLYQLTGDEKHLYRADCFGEWCTTWPEKQNHPPDRPLSLFEGIAGVLYFLIDLKDPDNAAFPAYSL